MNQVGMPSLVGKIGYIDSDSKLNTYPDENITLSNNYIEMNNFDSTGHDLPSAAFSNATLDDCKTACNSNKNCYGFVYNNNTKACYPKDKTMYPNGTKRPLSNVDLYVRKPTLINTPIGVPNTIVDIDSIRYNNYDKTNQNVSNSYGLSNITSVERQQMEQLKTKLDLLAKQIVTLNGTLHTNDINVNNQSIQNAKGLLDYLKESINTNNKLKTFNTNVDNILNDSDINVLYENYNYLFWSIIAAGTVLVSMNLIKNN